MKIPLQEKIAELERRILALEKWQDSSYYVQFTPINLEGFHQHWREMWRHFDAAIKSFFKAVKP